MRDDRERLLDVLESLDRIDRQARRGRDAFENDELVQTWIIHHVEIIGEAARGISEELRKEYPHVRWRELVAMRNVLAHGYFGIDVETIWSTVQHDLPALREQIEAILQALSGE